MACGFGSGPSDPLLSCTLIGSASTRRLAKIVKLENSQVSPSNRYDRFSREQMRSRVGSQLQRGRCAEGGIPDGAQRPFQSRAQRGTSAACSVRQAPPFNGNSRPALPPPHEEGGALEKSIPSATIFESRGGSTLETFNRCNVLDG